MKSDTIMCGDIHGKWGKLNTLINKKKPSTIIQCGDWGWWIHFHNKVGMYHDIYDRVLPKKWNQFGTKPQDTKIYWIGGNHENWDDLDKYEVVTELEPNIFFCPFGSVITLSTGEKCLMVGGALSTDIEDRKEGIDWWKQEIISQDDMDKLPATDIDIVISHTIPRTFLEITKWKTYDPARWNDPSTVALDIIFKEYKPKYWYSGHFHAYAELEIDGCKWTSLDCCNYQGQWWKYHV